MLHAGDTAPEFALPDETGRIVRLSELRAAGRVVVYFYPADFTPVCTAEACMFRDLDAELAAAELRVVGISPMSAAVKAKFKAANRLPFPLLVDAGCRTARAYGAARFFAGWGLPLPGAVKRVTYLIGEDGRVVDSVASELRVGAHEAFVKRALARAEARKPASA